MPTPTPEQVDEFIEKYGDMNEEQLILELGIHTLENAPDAMKVMLGREGSDEEVKELLDALKTQREEGTGLV